MLTDSEERMMAKYTIVDSLLNIRAYDLTDRLLTDWYTVMGLSGHLGIFRFLLGI